MLVIDMSLLRPTEDGTLVNLRVRPNSRNKDFVSMFDDSQIILNLQSPAREGKANKELIKKLARIMGISTADVIIVSGHKSRDKVILIKGKMPQEIARILRNQ